MTRGDKRWKIFQSAQSWLVIGFLDLLFLLPSLYITVLLRGFFPLGEEITAPIKLPPYILAVLGFAWLVAVFLIERTLANKRSRAYSLSLFFAVAGFSIMAFALIRQANDLSLSRLLLLYFPIGNTFFLAASRALQRSQALDRILAIPPQSLLIRARKGSELISKYYGEIGVAILVGAYWSSYILRMGLALTPDSVVYLRTVMRLVHGHEFIQSPHWPPLYPIAIALLTPFVPFPADAAALLSGVLVILFFLLLSLVLREISGNGAVNLIVILSLASLRSFMSVFQHAWSEQLFMVLLLLNLFLLLRYQKTKRSPLFYIACLAAGLAVVSRYAGFPIALAMLVYALYVPDPHAPLVARLRKYVLPLSLAFAPMLLLALANLLRYQEPVGYGLPSALLQNAPLLAITTIWNDLDLLLIAIGIGWALRRFGSPEQAQPQNAKLPLVLGLLFWSYLAFIVLVSSFVPVTVGSRVLAPAYIYLMAYLVFLFANRDSGSSRPLVGQSGFYRIAFALSSALLLLSLFIRLIDIQEVLVRRPDVLSNAPSEVKQEGFELGSTGQALRGELRQILGDNDHILLLVSEEEHIFAETLLYRGTLFRDWPLGKVGFERLESSGFEYSRNELAFELLFVDGGETGRVSYLDYKFAPSPPRLIGDLQEFSARFDVALVYLLINEAWLINHQLDPDDIPWPDDVSVRSQNSIPPYVTVLLEFH